MGTKYKHKEIEKKWKDKWAEDKTYKTPEINEGDNKQYILDMFPYPSGKAMHVGHAEGYIATDILSRFSRMKGYKVLHPMGWDAFGLPAENYAIKNGVHPRINTDNSIVTFIDQLNTLGLSYDWDKEIGSHRPDYYKWTQWFFLLLYKKGLAYKKEAPVNWCESCKTTLANEQVINGRCERCDTVVVQKNMNQWFFKITDYAERLIKDLDKVDWPESTKINQINWIGRSEGAEIDFIIDGINKKLRVFTTRLDTIFGATFMVLSPEHPILETIVTKEKKEEVENYQEEAKKKTELERTSLDKDKSGVFTGAYAINPYSGKRIPIWISDFVISTYGTGALMAVPAHDERDFEFAKKFNIGITQVVQPINQNESFELPYTLKDGVIINSQEFNGLTVKEAFDQLVKIAEEKGFGNRKINYRLRDWLVSRQRYWGAPVPIVYDPEGNPHAVEEKDLPVILPDDVEFMPTGESPLKYHEGFHKLAEDKYGKGWKREVDTLDTFVDSSWYFFRFTDPNNTKEFASINEINKWCPVDVYMGGAEHTVLHLMYARFFTKVLFDEGIINFDEPFLKLRHQGMILGEDSRKMSKRWGNVINPSEVAEELGIDSLRIYEMFMGPIDATKPWSTSGIKGARRFLDRVYNIQNVILDNGNNQEIDIELNKLIKKVGDDIKELKFNTSVAEFMKFVNLVEEKKQITTEQFKKFILVMAPFAPFIAEELWQVINDNKAFNLQSSVHNEQWPTYDESLVKDKNITIGVQINGKIRSQLIIDIDENDEIVKQKVLELEDVKKWVSNNEIKKFVYVKGRIVNIVI